jgi:hypothetical protein
LQVGGPPVCTCLQQQRQRGSRCAHLYMGCPLSSRLTSPPSMLRPHGMVNSMTVEPASAPIPTASSSCALFPRPAEQRLGASVRRCKENAIRAQSTYRRREQSLRRAQRCVPSSLAAITRALCLPYYRQHH